jgi:hypothetical protein
MQEDLPGLVRELRKETCPQRVIDEVSRRIAVETPPPRRLRLVIPVALAGIVLLCALLLARWRPAGGDARRQTELVEQAHGRTQAAREAETALGLIASALLDAGARSETTISERAILPLRNGFDTARNKIIHHTQL